MFDEKEYWNNRKKGLRGQGDDNDKDNIYTASGGHAVTVGNRIVNANRKTARRKTPTDSSRTKITGGYKTEADRKAIIAKVNKREAIARHHAEIRKAERAALNG